MVPTRGEPSLGEQPIVVGPNTLVLPLDPYLIRGSRGRTLDLAVQRLAADCMRRFGFEVEFPPPPVDPLAVNERRYGLADLSRAQQYGYHVPEIENLPRRKEPELSPEGQTLLTGAGPNVVGGQKVPEGGCFGEARRRLADGRTPPSDEDLAQQLSIEAHQLTLEDSRGKAVIAAWASCMERRGFEYSLPFNVPADPAFNTGKVSQHEIEVATADVECKLSVNFVETLAAIDTAYQLRAIEQHRDQLEEIWGWIEVMLRNASTIIEPK